MMCERKILVVDDEVDLLQMIETTLNTVRTTEKCIGP